jgi:hypothetical protein
MDDDYRSKPVIRYMRGTPEILSKAPNAPSSHCAIYVKPRAKNGY